jgi:hypothetical protein
MLQVVTLALYCLSLNLNYLFVQLRDLCDIKDKFKLISIYVLQK